MLTCFLKRIVQKFGDLVETFQFSNDCGIQLDTLLFWIPVYSRGSTKVCHVYEKMYGIKKSHIYYIKYHISYIIYPVTHAVCMNVSKWN